jgi:hypothetical protein
MVFKNIDITYLSCMNKKLIYPLIIIISVAIIIVCSIIMNAKSKPRQEHFTEEEVLGLLNQAYKGIPNGYYPQGLPGDIKYNFFLDLEHGYCVTAGNRIHLYADKTRWAIVFEKSGYQNRGDDAEIELDYVGNCIDYPVDKYSDRNYITNSSRIVLITPKEYDRIHNTQGKDMETFELISPDVAEIDIRGKKIRIEHDSTKYLQLGIHPRSGGNPNHLIGFGDLVRYINETEPGTISATSADIKQYIPKDLPELMTIDKFHYESVYTSKMLPSDQETYQLIAKVLVSRNPSFWKPAKPANNHWTNWESGNL